MPKMKCRHRVLAKELMLLPFHKDETIAQDMAQEGADLAGFCKIVTLVHKEVRKETRICNKYLVPESIQQDQLLPGILFSQV